MKILFVEDELSKNIPRIIRLFSKYLGKKRKEKLEEAESDESGYGAEPEEIKRIVEETGLIDIEYRFPDAMRKLIHHENYSLFIIDRNLAESVYELNEVNAIDSNYTESQHVKYFGREGDYFLYKLAIQSVDVKNKFYYLTAYSVQDEIRGQEDIQTLIEHFGDFKTENFIEKGNNKDLEKLKDIIDNIPILNLQHENRAYLNILRKHIGDKDAENFLNILEDKEKEQCISNNFNKMRLIYEQILKICAERLPDMKANCSDEYGNINTGKKTMDWLSREHINSIIRNFLFSIKAIASDFGSHSNIERSRYEPTLNTVNSLIYALKDIILWFGKICSKYSK